jgi:hydrogenase maturation protease
LDHRSDRPTLILGLGNPILCDDRVGLVVARMVHGRLPEGTAALREAHVGGIELLHVLEGFARVLVIDAVEPGWLQPADVAEIPLDDLAQRYTPISPHNAGFLHCLELGRACGLAMPDQILVFAIGVRDPYTFSDSCTPEVERAIPRIVGLIEERVFGPQGCWPPQPRNTNSR